MNTKQLIELTADKFKEIYTDEKFRNEVAYAHGSYAANMEFKHLKTCSYPIEYIVTEAQVKEATNEIERAKAQTLKDNAGKLLFVGMGSVYAPRYEDDVCNHRIRTEFINSKGKSYFVEFGTGRGEDTRCDHSVDRDLENEYDSKLEELREYASTVEKYSQKWNNIQREIDLYNKQPYYNFKGLEHSQTLPKYTKQNILKLVNKTFDCNFEEIVIDNYNISVEDKAICFSPNLINSTI